MDKFFDGIMRFFDFCGDVRDRILIPYEKRPHFHYVRRQRERMINWGMGKTFEIVWFDSKKNRNVVEFVIV